MENVLAEYRCQACRLVHPLKTHGTGRQFDQRRRRRRSRLFGERIWMYVRGFGCIWGCHDIRAGGFANVSRDERVVIHVWEARGITTL